MKSIRKVVGSVALAVLAFSMSAMALNSPTAKAAVGLANAKLDPIVQDQVLMMEGFDSDSNLRPRIWDITYYDAKRIQGGTMVRVKDGAVVSITGSFRLFDDARWSRFGRNFSGYDLAEIISVGRWMLDSDQVLATALSQTKLAGLQVTKVVMTLRKPSDGDVAPAWLIEFRARPVNNPRRERWIGYLQYDAETGKLLRDELRVEGMQR